MASLDRNAALFWLVTEAIFTVVSKHTNNVTSMFHYYNSDNTCHTEFVLVDMTPSQERLAFVLS